MSENRGAIVMEEPDRTPGVLPETGDRAGAEADAVLQESAKLAEITRRAASPGQGATPSAETVFELKDLSVTYGGSYAVQGVNMSIRKNEITALIGPSGCGKTTVLRCLNRTNDLIHGAKVHGGVLYHGHRPVRPQGRAGGGPPAHRHGLPEAEPVPQVDLRQHRLRSPGRRLQGQHGRAGGAVAPHGPRSGTR